MAESNWNEAKDGGSGRKVRDSKGTEYGRRAENEDKV